MNPSNLSSRGGYAANRTLPDTSSASLDDNGTKVCVRVLADDPGLRVVDFAIPVSLSSPRVIEARVKPGKPCISTATRLITVADTARHVINVAIFLIYVCYSTGNTFY